MEPIIVESNPAIQEVKDKFEPYCPLCGRCDSPMIRICEEHQAELLKL